jgi:hypothetical protein
MGTAGKNLIYPSSAMSKKGSPTAPIILCRVASGTAHGVVPTINSKCNSTHLLQLPLVAWTDVVYHLLPTD